MWAQLSISYYWLMYVLGFIFGYLIIKKKAVIKKENLDDLLFYMFLWVIIGGRIWYILFYDLSFFLENPLNILKIWEGWMSFHGGVVGVIIAILMFSKKFKFSFYKLADEITAIAPIWIWLGRIWNYLNKELLGFSNYSWPLAVYKNWIWYFPSPLIEFFLEGLVLFIILNIAYKKRLFNWQIACLFLILYWVFRIIVEIFFRIPDSHIWYIFWYFTMWELLSLPMILGGLYFYFRYSLNNKANKK